MQSLRQRAITGGTIWAVLTILLGGVVLFSFFTNVTNQRFDREVAEAHAQLVFALESSSGNTGLLNIYLDNPSYYRAFSGKYWQIITPEGDLMRSRSLVDTYFPEGLNLGASLKYWDGLGPHGGVRGVSQKVVLNDGSTWGVTVAHALSVLHNEQLIIRQNLFSTFGLIGVLGVAAAVTMASLIVRPLTNLRRDVSERWQEGTSITPTDYPEEVAPLVKDINLLLNRNRELVLRTRSQAADMAHALKTPSAILRNELEVLGIEGVDVGQAQEALARIDAQLQRSLARIRAANSGAGLAEWTELKESIDRLSRLFRSINEREGRHMSTFVPTDIKVPMDVQDLEEVLGNLIENAFKHCDCQVHVSAERVGGNAQFCIEDDGPGIPESDRLEALRAGGRLDTTKPGTGLGLAIAMDLMKAYAGTLDLQSSDDLGGLRVVCTVPLKPFALETEEAASHLESEHPDSGLAPA